jgi:FkbM family methyltransferase
LIEPLPGMAAELRAHFRPPRYQVFECAASSRKGPAEFEINPYQPTSSLLPLKRDLVEMSNFDLRPGVKITCTTRTLDDIAAEAGLEKLDLLKLDVQGAELMALAGARELLKVTSWVWTEVSFRPQYEGSCVFAEVYAFLNEAGYRLMDVQPGYRSVQGELLQADVLFQRL